MWAPLWGLAIWNVGEAACRRDPIFMHLAAAWGGELWGKMAVGAWLLAGAPAEWLTEGPGGAKSPSGDDLEPISG